MKKFAVGQLQGLTMLWMSLGYTLREEYNADSTLIITEHITTVIKARFEHVERLLIGFGLVNARKYLKKIHEKLDGEYMSYATTGYPWEEYQRDLEVLEGRIDDDLQEIVFGFIPKNKVAYFRQEKLFGDEVYDVFRLASKDIQDAGTCFAHEDYSATVFHLMRVAEIGAKKLVRDLRVISLLPKPIELCDWNTLLSAMEKGLKKLDVGSGKSVKKKRKLEYYSKPIGLFRNFKDSWRNSAAHSRRDFQPGETQDILDNTRQFMQHLAKGFK